MDHLPYSKALLVVLMCVALCDSARILAISPFIASSHQIFVTSLFKELARRGHQLTVYTVKPQEDVPSNYTQITVDMKHEPLGGGKNMFDRGDISPLVILPLMWYSSGRSSQALMDSPSIQQLIHSTDNKYDLLMVELFFNDAILGFSHKFNIPIVSIVTFSGLEVTKDYMGDPFPYSYVPSPLLDYNDHMTFFQRLRNTMYNLMTKVGHHLFFIPGQDAVMRNAFAHIPNFPSLTDIYKNTSLILLNTHFSLGFPRPKVPNVIDVGAMHIKPPKKLPQDIQKYLDDAKDGVVYFSMGSNLKSADMSVSKREAFLKAFARIKQRVLWKFEEELPGIPENVMIKKWLPQSDILGHPKIRVFMTHGGALGTQEAMYNAVPLVGIPIFGDQQLNVNRAVETGYALLLDYKNITEESVYWTLNEMINDPKYKQVAERVSRIFHDQPETPMERAVYWVEYVLRHNGAHHLRSAAPDLTWYQYYLIDVVLVLLASFGTFIVLLLWLIRTLLKLLLRKQHKTKNSKKKN